MSYELYVQFVWPDGYDRQFVLLNLDVLSYLFA